MINLPDQYHVLVVDDEPDVYALTRLSLKGIKYRDRPVEMVEASTGKQAIETMQAQPDIAVILLDVVMETTSAGLDACRVIREDLGNRTVRILLRTGQPGAAPERKVIEEYDIDGYLSKTELTVNRLYTSVRSAIKAFEELVLLERHRQVLTFVHDSVTSLRAFEPLETTLERILQTAVAVAPSRLAVLNLETFEEKGNPQRCCMHISTEGDPALGEAVASEIATRIASDPAAHSLGEPRTFSDGFLLPLALHRELGHGWIYLEGARPDAVALQALPLLATHASNALYASVAQSLLQAREGPFYESMTV